MRIAQPCRLRTSGKAVYCASTPRTSDFCSETLAQELSEHGNGKLLGINEMRKRTRRSAGAGTRRLSSRDKKGVRRVQQGRECRADMLGRCRDSLRRESGGQVRDEDPNLHELRVLQQSREGGRTRDHHISEAANETEMSRIVRVHRTRSPNRTVDEKD